MKTSITNRRIYNFIRGNLIKAVSSEPVREIQSWPGFVSYLQFMRRRDRKYIVDINGRMGMGALLAKAIQFYSFADKVKIDLEAVSSCPLYCTLGEKDLFSKYFYRNIDFPEREYLSDGFYKWSLRKAVPKNIGITDSSRMFHKHFKPTDYLYDKVEDFLERKGRFDLSVHYRGTDKVLESGALNYDVVINPVKDLIKFDGVHNIFLATDDAEFSALFRREFKGFNIESFDLAFVPNGVPRHFSSMSPDEKALEALINSYVIASSPLCIRTSSYLSSLSKIINPKMKTMTVNRTRAKRVMYPEDSVIESE